MTAANPDNGIKLSAHIQAAIEEHMAETGGGMLTSFVLMAAYIDSDGAKAWMMRVPQQQGLFETVGLVEWTNACVRNETNTYFNQLNSEDTE